MITGSFNLRTKPSPNITVSLSTEHFACKKGVTQTMTSTVSVWKGGEEVPQADVSGTRYVVAVSKSSTLPATFVVSVSGNVINARKGTSAADGVLTVTVTYYKDPYNTADALTFTKTIAVTSVADGAAGKDGADGADGKDGVVYELRPSTQFFTTAIYQGERITTPTQLTCQAFKSVGGGDLTEVTDCNIYYSADGGTESLFTGTLTLSKNVGTYLFTLHKDTNDGTPLAHAEVVRLDNPSGVNPNLLDKTEVSTQMTGNWRAGGTGTTLVSDTGGGLHFIRITHETGSGYARYYATGNAFGIQLQPETTYTLSAMVYSNTARNNVFVVGGHYTKANFQNRTSFSVTVKKRDDNIESRKWTQVYVTFTTPALIDGFTEEHIEIHVNNSGTATSPQGLCFYNAKLEEGAEATAWCVSEADKKGDKGESGFNGCITRVFTGGITNMDGTSTTRTYRNDSSAQSTPDGMRYLDFMAMADPNNTANPSGWRVYRCENTYEVTASSVLGDPANDSAHWTGPISSGLDAFYTHLVAKSANIQMLSGGMFVIHNESGQTTAGMGNYQNDGKQYSFWSGGETPETATFSVSTDGTVTARTGVFSGFTKNRKTRLFATTFLNYATEIIGDSSGTITHTGVYTFDFDRCGKWIEIISLPEDFTGNNVQGLKTFLPSFFPYQENTETPWNGNFKQSGLYTKFRDEARSLVGNSFFVYYKPYQVNSPEDIHYGFRNSTIREALDENGYQIPPNTAEIPIVFIGNFRLNTNHDYDRPTETVTIIPGEFIYCECSTTIGSYTADQLQTTGSWNNTPTDELYEEVFWRVKKGKIRDWGEKPNGYIVLTE